MKSKLADKFSFKQKVAIIFVIVHLLYVAFVFHRENKIFANLEAYCTMRSDGQVGMPFPMLVVSELYYFIPAAYFDRYVATEEIPRFIRFSGTGGACTFSTINSALPYSLLFIVVSSVVYYIVGFGVGSVWKILNQKD